jgi:hypothetical protein
MEGVDSSETIQMIYQITQRYILEGGNIHGHYCEKLVAVTHSLMELSPSWEAANCAATQELPRI